jgi:hypothetical protein
MLIICSHRSQCPDMFCHWRHQQLNHDEIKGRCATIGKMVHVYEVDKEMMSNTDPNMAFERKKHGL